MPAAVAVVGLAATAYAANKQSHAAKDAAKTQAQSANDANQLQYQIYQQQRQDNEPFRQNALTAQNEYMALLGLAPMGSPTSPTKSFAAGGAGPQTLGTVTGAYQPASRPTTNGIGRLVGGNPHRQLDPVGEGYVPPVQSAPRPVQQQAAPVSTHAPAAPQLTPEQAQQAAFDRFRNTPGYQFGLKTGFDQVQASAAARGGLYSGATMKALQKFGNDYADQQGYTPYMNRLASLAGMGQTVNAQNAQLGMNYANQAGSNLLSAGNARASGLLGQAQAQSNLASNIAGIGGWLGGQYTWGGV